MPYCPKCKFEYEAHIKTCPECGAALVEELPKGEKQPELSEEDLVVVYKTSEEYEAVMVKRVLEEAGIACVEKVYRTPWVMQGFFLTPYGRVYSRLLTAASRAQEAEAVIRDFFEAYHKGELEIREAPSEKGGPASNKTADKRPRRRKF